jgi:two-component sensor histidine kinase
MEADGRGPRVLYIDDDPGIGRLVQRHLERNGCTVQVATSAEDGLALARTGTFDAIALDHYMPGRDGLDMLRELRSLPAAPPVIFCTGAEEPRIAVAALKQGAADYVVKDVHGSFLELLATGIVQEIARARLQRDKEAAEREVRQSRDQLEQLAQRQAILLREVNHRVANSLQLISSLIELQARKVPDPEARGMLRQAAERVEAVSLVHRRLYTSDDVAVVELDAYLKGLVEELGRLTRLHRIELSADPVSVETDKAVPIGLIVNELVTNAVKYAYPDGVQGVVRVILRKLTGQGVRLVVEDDGAGMPAASAPRGSGLGSLIVASMARTLRATIDRDPDHRGTRFVLSMPA